MPTRIIRDGILTSEAVNSLDWESEVFFRRLMSVVDDYGRFDARPTILRSTLYALKLESMRESSVQRCLRKCEAARLIVLYVVDGKPYLEICKFGQKVRTKAKWPAPADNLQQHVDNLPATCMQSAARGVDEGVDEGEYEDEGERNVATLSCSSPPGADDVRRVMGELMLAPLVGQVMDECVTRYMDEMESNGWLNRNGMPLRDWRGTARNWARRYAEREAKSLPSASTSTHKDCNDPSRYRKNRY